MKCAVKFSVLCLAVVFGSAEIALCADVNSSTVKLSGRQNPEAFSVPDIVFSFYRGTIELQDKRPELNLGIARLQSVLKIDEATAKSFIQYMQNAVKESNAYAESLQQSIVCKNRSGLTSRESLAVAMNEVDRQTDAHRAGYVNNSVAIIGQEKKEALDLYASEKLIPNTTEVRTNYLQGMIEKNRQVPEMLVSMCGVNAK